MKHEPTYSYMAHEVQWDVDARRFHGLKEVS